MLLRKRRIASRAETLRSDIERTPWHAALKLDALLRHSRSGQSTRSGTFRRDKRSPARPEPRRGRAELAGLIRNTSPPSKPKPGLVKRRSRRKDEACPV